MTKQRYTGLAVGLMALMAAGAANAQELREAGSPGNFGGAPSFGGFYETFGSYGGRNTYSGYSRTYGSVTAPTSFLETPVDNGASVPKSGRHCGWLKKRADDSGLRKWKARYEACRHDE